MFLRSRAVLFPKHLCHCYAENKTCGPVGVMLIIKIIIIIIIICQIHIEDLNKYISVV